MKVELYDIGNLLQENALRVRETFLNDCPIAIYVYVWYYSLYNILILIFKMTEAWFF